MTTEQEEEIIILTELISVYEKRLEQLKKCSSITISIRCPEFQDSKVFDLNSEQKNASTICVNARGILSARILENEICIDSIKNKLNTLMS